MQTQVFSSQYIQLYDRDGWIYASRREGNPQGSPTEPNAMAMCGSILTNAGRRLVLLREYRVPLQGFEISFPAGLVDSGETPQDAAIREFREETGLQFSPLFQSPNKLSSSAGITDELCPIVFGTAMGEVSLNPGINHEKIEVLLVSRTELQALLSKDYYFGARSWAILYSLAVTGSFANQIYID